MQGVLEGPLRPINPETHSPQVPITTEHPFRFKEEQFGAFEQLIWFKAEVVSESTLFKSSGLLVDWEAMILSVRKLFSASVVIVFSVTDTVNAEREEESSESETEATQDKFEDLVPFTLSALVPEGRRVEAEDNCCFDLRIETLKSPGVKYPNS
jgi:hypothetical protein